MNCCICGLEIIPEEGDMCVAVGDTEEYMCWQHFKRINKMILQPEAVEKALEYFYGGTAVIEIDGSAEFTIKY